MIKLKKFIYYLALIPLVVILALFGWFFAVMFEGENPGITLQPAPEFLTEDQAFKLNISDRKRGLKDLKVSLEQEGRELTLFEEKFPFKGFLNRQGVHEFDKEFTVEPSALKLAQGRVELRIRAWDYSRRHGGDGNLSITVHKMLVDTLPPSLRTVSRMHNINVGGSALVLYQTSSDAIQSGVYVGDLFFSGFPTQHRSEEGFHACYFALPHDSGANPSISLWARDRAGNESRTGFYCHVINKRFRKDKIKLSESFLKRIIQYFASTAAFPAGASDLEKYLYINNAVRKENNLSFYRVGQKTSPLRLWDGPWMRLSNAATMARFGDRRAYYFQGEMVDEQVHMGIDLASLANSPVEAANTGRVVFADGLGIYGSTVVLDHGQGLASLYGHLSKIEVTSGQEVKKGDIIGYTGQTGLAGGDHLHFGIMVHGVFVNPIEWWDPHWIQDNVTRKLALLQ
ncbi:MAG: M23 family metallopeptidase [Deltaproteobacteria bacterium]|nr:M23 family metallopeptidase [Deltaproteobacteria bacterium]